MKKKAREFWINDFKFGPDESVSQEVIVDTIPNCGYNDEDKLHVIEYSAYRKLKDQLDRLIRERDYSEKGHLNLKAERDHQYKVHREQVDRIFELSTENQKLKEQLETYKEMFKDFLRSDKPATLTPDMKDDEQLEEIK